MLVRRLTDLLAVQYQSVPRTQNAPMRLPSREYLPAVHVTDDGTPAPDWLGASGGHLAGCRLAQERADEDAENDPR